MLSIAAQEADIVGINGKTTATGGFDLSSLTPEATDQKVAWVQAAAGARFAALELSVLMPFVAITDKPQEVAARYVQDWGTEYMTPLPLGFGIIRWMEYSRRREHSRAVGQDGARNE